MNINDYKTKYDALSEKCNLTGKEALEAVKQNGHALKYVNIQTPELCLEAVREDGYTLQYVHIQTPEICLAAVREDGYALKYVNTQTPEICLEAVKQNGYALQFVNENIFDKDSLSGKEVSLTIYGKTYTAIIK
jgi:hypothetical protein